MVINESKHKLNAIPPIEEFTRVSSVSSSMKNEYSPIELSKALEPKLGESDMIWWHPCGEDGKLKPEIVKKTKETINRILYPAYHWSIFLTPEVAKKLWGEKKPIGHRESIRPAWQYNTQQLLEALHDDKFWEVLEGLIKAI